MPIIYTLQSGIEGGGNKRGVEKSLKLNSRGVVIIGDGGGKTGIGKILMYTETNKT